MQSSAASSHFFALRFKYSLQHPVLKQPPSMFFLSVTDQVPHPCIVTGKIMVLYTVISKFVERRDAWTEQLIFLSCRSALCPVRVVNWTELTFISCVYRTLTNGIVANLLIAVWCSQQLDLLSDPWKGTNFRDSTWSSSKKVVEMFGKRDFKGLKKHTPLLSHVFLEKGMWRDGPWLIKQ
jgi:hypothetical protein